MEFGASSGSSQAAKETRYYRADTQKKAGVRTDMKKKYSAEGDIRIVGQITIASACEALFCINLGWYFDAGIKKTSSRTTKRSHRPRCSCSI